MKIGCAYSKKYCRSFNIVTEVFSYLDKPLTLELQKYYLWIIRLFFLYTHNIKVYFILNVNYCFVKNWTQIELLLVQPTLGRLKIVKKRFLTTLNISLLTLEAKNFVSVFISNEQQHRSDYFDLFAFNSILYSHSLIAI